jgi:Flp pilus assembly protein TadD
MSARTLSYVAWWNDRLAFYAYQAQVQPESFRVHGLLAQEAIRQDRPDLAQDAADAMVRLRPQDWFGWIVHADAALAAGELEQAMTAAMRARDLEPNVATAGAVTRVRRAMPHLPATRPAPDGDAP